MCNKITKSNKIPPFGLMQGDKANDFLESQQQVEQASKWSATITTPLPFLIKWKTFLLSQK